MRIKVLCIETGVESVFDTAENHLSIQMSEQELEWIKAMPASASGESPAGCAHRTFSILATDSDDEESKLFEWAKA